MTRAWVLCFAVLCACARSSGDERLSDGSLKRSTAATSSSSGPAQAAAPIDAAAVPAIAPDASQPGAAASGCADVSAAFQARLAAASGACATAADCACFTSIVDAPACAGVTDATSARELNDLAARFRAAGCRLPRQCGPGRCAPQCVDHRCR